MCSGNVKKIKSIKAVCFVAHPDDCIIYAKPFLDATPYIEWSILYLTYSKDHPRSMEVSKYWKHRTYSLEQPDLALDYFTGTTSICELQTANLARPHFQDTRLILTHGSEGEYGHVHHKLVHNVCKTIPIPKVFFSNDGLILANKRIDASHLPIHKNAINKYYKPVRMYDISDEARSIIIEAKKNDTR